MLKIWMYKLSHEHIKIVTAFRRMHVSPAKKIAMRDYQESVTTGQTHGRTDAGQSDPYKPLCFAGDTKYIVIPICATMLRRRQKYVSDYLNVHCDNRFKVHVTLFCNVASCDENMCTNARERATYNVVITCAQSLFLNYGNKICLI